MNTTKPAQFTPQGFEIVETGSEEVIMWYWLLIIIILAYLLIASYVGIYGGVLW